MSARGTVAARQRVVIAGGGFAGFHAARRLGRLANTAAGAPRDQEVIVQRFMT
jgi:NADH dehydrogenase FAD-containing subunit